MPAVHPQPLVMRCDDGYALRGTLFAPSPEHDRHCTVIVCPAIFVRERFYADFAAFLAEQGFSALTFSNRGMGGSLAAETRAWNHRLRDWGERDLPAVIAHAREARPEGSLYVVGHSMGGQLVALSEAVHELRGVVTVGATAAWWGHWSYPDNVAILAWYGVAPLLCRVLATIPAERVGLGPDVSSLLVRDWVRWGRNRHYLYGPFGLRSRMEAYRGRVLCYSFTDDAHLGCLRAVRALHDHYTGAELTHQHVSPREVGVARLGHFGFFRKGVGERLWTRTIAWIERDASGLTRGTDPGAGSRSPRNP